MNHIQRNTFLCHSYLTTVTESLQSNLTPPYAINCKTIKLTSSFKHVCNFSRRVVHRQAGSCISTVTHRDSHIKFAIPARVIRVQFLWTAIYGVQFVDNCTHAMDTKKLAKRNNWGPINNKCCTQVTYWWSDQPTIALTKLLWQNRDNKHNICTTSRARNRPSLCHFCGLSFIVCNL